MAGLPDRRAMVWVGPPLFPGPDLAEIIGPCSLALRAVGQQIRIVFCLSVFYSNRRNPQPVRNFQPIRWMDFPHGFIFEDDNSAFVVLVMQPMFLTGSGVEGHH